MAKGKGGAKRTGPSRNDNRPNGKAWKQFIHVMKFDERKQRFKQVRVPNPNK